MSTVEPGVLQPEDIRDTASKMLAAPLFFPDEFKRWLSDFVATNIPMIPYSSIFGSKLNTARSGSYVETSETPVSSSSYGDMATYGPFVDNLADGSYLLMYGAQGRDFTSVSVNGATAVDDDSIWGREAAPAGARMKIVSLKSNNNNSVVLKYKGGSSISHRWLVVMRLGAP